MIRTGPQNAITDVPGIRVGHAEDPDLVTGTTVILPEDAALCAVDHRGGAIGARDTIALSPGSIGGWVHAICLSGGSAFGLDASGGVMDGLRRQGRGFEFGGALVPIVPGAIIFDLAVGEKRDWGSPPWWNLGHRAFEAATDITPLGNVGAGLGATAGDLKGGLGTASYLTDDYTIAALAIVNPVGSTIIPGTDTFWSWIHEQNGELGGQTPPPTQPDILKATPTPEPGTNTTLVVVATDATLDRNDAQRVAIMAQDGLARAINPIHSPFDGDTVFVLSTGKRDRQDATTELMRLGSLAASVTARAIARGVYEAEALAGYPAYRDRFRA